MANIRPLSHTLAERARIDLNETPEQIANDLKAIKHWLKMSPHIKARTDDQFLVGFMRGCKYSLEKVKVKLDTFYTVRSEYYKKMAGRDPFNEKVMMEFRAGFAIKLEMVSHSGDVPCFVLIKTGNYNVENVSMNDLLESTINAVDIQLDDDEFLICGQAIIIDCENYTMAHASQYTPIFIKQCLMLFVNATPLRLKAVHYINLSPAFFYIITILKPFLSEKLKNRLFIHQSLDELHQHVPIDVLPKEYGGNAAPVKDLFVKNEEIFRNYRNLLIESTQYGVDESKRPNKAKNFKTMDDNLDGSFRQLRLD